MKAIRIEDLTVQRPDGFRLGPLSLELAAGSRTALVGRSGCGKTTLLRCIAGLQSIDRGRIAFDDRLVSGGGRPLDPSQRHIGFVFQDGGLWPHMSALAHLRFANPGLRRPAAMELLSHVGLDHLYRRKPPRLSGGEAQRLALARALATEPEILLLDEPLNAVDTALRAQLAELICHFATIRNLTVLLVTHDEREATSIAQRVLVMDGGRLVEDGAVPARRRQPGAEVSG